MDKRKYKRVAFAMGLLFLILGAEGTLFYQLGTKLRMEEQKRIGALVREHPQLEQDYIAIFGKKNPDGTKKEQESVSLDQKAGRELEKKYGYTLDAGISREILRKYLFLMMAVLVAGVTGVVGLLVKSSRDRQDLKEELDRTKERLKECQVHYEQMKQSLEAEENDTKTLVTDISHQLKTPIASLKMSFEIADTTDLSEKEREAFREKEYEEVLRLEALLASLMNLSKLEAKLIQIRKENTSLKETLVKAVNSVYMKAFDKNIEIEMEEFPDRKIPHDPKWTVEVAVNILDNGIKYSPEGTHICIRVTEMVTYMLIEIEDEGIGIPSKEMHKVFRRFYRGSNVEGQDQNGSGVGLYLARRIVEEQGGSICVKQKHGKGSIFQIMLLKN